MLSSGHTAPIYFRTYHTLGLLSQTAVSIATETLDDLRVAVADNLSETVTRMLETMCGSA
jgi:hypothetical protein